MSDQLTTYQATDNDLARFASKIELPANGDDENGCWIWVGAKHSATTLYGKFRLGGTVQNAHKASYLMFNGEVAAGMVVAHQCNNSACVNPAHLEVQTQSQNMKFCVMSGRHNSQRSTQ